MYSIMKFTIALAAIAGYASATTYANFCDDTECTVNCGISVSTDNPGCLQEYGRQSISFHDDNVQEVRLVFSPDDGCSCQSECIDVVRTSNEGGIGGGPGCLDLTGHMPAQSFRFVGGATCDPNNC